jgi:hypothetical protein
MSREAFGDPPEQQEAPECCPNCGSDFYMPGCTHCDEVKRRCAAESEALALRGVLHRMLEAPTTQISVGWKDAIRRAMSAAVPDSKTPNVADKRHVTVLRDGSA